MQFLTAKGPLPPGRYIVVTLDICSASDVIEDLTNNQAIGRYLELLTTLKRELAKIQGRVRNEHATNLFFYQFTGDGWILLLEAERDDQRARALGRSLLRGLRRLSVVFRRAYAKLEKHLDSPPMISGINFGIDVGWLKHTVIFQRDEYISRAINIACRLQGAIRNKDKSPAYKALATRTVFNKYLSPARGYRPDEINCTLRNINRNRPMQCFKLKVLGQP